MSSDNKLDVYFSLRSPYAWLGCYRLAKAVKEIDIDYQMIPISPPKKMLPKLMPTQDRLQYIINDVRRMASAYGLTYRRPDPFDCDWTVPHVAFLKADEQGKGLEFVINIYDQRFQQGKDISTDEVITETAEICGLSPETLLPSNTDKLYRRKLLETLITLAKADVFGVPSFVFNGEVFWGNDRLEWCLRAIYTEQGKPVPDLAQDVMTRPF